MKNKHPATCCVCFSQVRPGEGVVTRRPGGWDVRHPGCDWHGEAVTMRVDAGEIRFNLLVRSGFVVDAPGGAKHMIGWTTARAMAYCSARGWRTEL